jgi:hypothetical protein
MTLQQSIRNVVPLQLAAQRCSIPCYFYCCCCTSDATDLSPTIREVLAALLQSTNAASSRMIPGMGSNVTYHMSCSAGCIDA